MRVKVRVKSHSRCSLEPQAHSAAPNALCIPALRPEGAGPEDLGEVALRGKGHRSGVKGHSLSTPPFHPLPLTDSLRLHHPGASAATWQPGSIRRSRNGGSRSDFRHNPSGGGDECYRGAGPNWWDAGRKCVRRGPPWLPRSPPFATSSLRARDPLPAWAPPETVGLRLPPPQVRPSPQPSSLFSELLLSSCPFGCSESAARVPLPPLLFGPRDCHTNPSEVGGSGAIVLATEGVFLPSWATWCP